MGGQATGSGSTGEDEAVVRDEDEADHLRGLGKAARWKVARQGRTKGDKPLTVMPKSCTKPPKPRPRLLPTCSINIFRHQRTHCHHDGVSLGHCFLSFQSYSPDTVAVHRRMEVWLALAAC